MRFASYVRDLVRARRKTPPPSSYPKTRGASAAQLRKQVRKLGPLRAAARIQRSYFAVAERPPSHGDAFRAAV